VTIGKAADSGGELDHEITAAKGVFRGDLEGNEGTGALFRVATDGRDKVFLTIEVTDDVYTADPKEYFFPIGKGWAWKDKVDIYLGFAKHPGIQVRGLGGMHPPKNAPRYVHTLGRHELTSNSGNTIWVEARCGEKRLGCYSYKERVPGDEPDIGEAEWRYSAEEKKWTGRIEIDVKAVDSKLTVDKMTGFNLGVQDVDEPCDFLGRPRRGGKAPFYMLYEPFPHGVQDTARYADVEIEE